MERLKLCVDDGVVLGEVESVLGMGSELVLVTWSVITSWNVSVSSISSLTKGFVLLSIQVNLLG